MRRDHPSVSKCNHSHVDIVQFFLLLYYYYYFRQEGERSASKYRRQLVTWQVFYQVERRFHSWESNRQPLPWGLGISLSSSSSLGSYWTQFFFIDVRYIVLWIPPTWWWVISKKSWTSTSYLSYSTGSFVASGLVTPAHCILVSGLSKNAARINV